ncbi:hypothetical protein [Paraburkholderia caballeronis]|uniref:Uncharacterized protein n=1 Tax=Paraburkholderia caballeronis TaxID=416943 RepID=A0A1H7MTF3_9BURK|nr:hypothetical protein [Paraburkholderia caballeronis]PXW26427.1 hypothetical protein C7403_104301 [Paraburkholderia caballeronis]PXX01974.1 hypothetical protein C7407_104301 [Paraburkholderia caballeronis]RAK01131.1 hypothetical protein C7409_104301 [Paraburkholderia caballeronis]SEB96257.1 hypothetical protein SAMN05445871_1394 [Paraburkholderia caballeronis]SEL14504.1 hypothetical protein SAMN05192542_105168 [Paraburkholderia caballeronis]
MHDPFDNEPDWNRDGENHGTTYPPYSSGAHLICPYCQSSRVEPLNRARKVGGTAGTVAGAVSSITIALSGAEAGATFGLIAGPVGAACGGIAGAILAGLAGGAAGCATGIALGEMVDARVLDNARCLDCQRTFSTTQP